MDIKKYIYGHCVNPQNIEVFDAYSGRYIRRQVPCGKCLHCTNTHVNEWCTRLFAQRKYSKYCYYVSLDYAPFTLSDPVSHRLAVETAACYHNINKYHHYGMHPLVLCKNHLQDFYKRLRKNTGIKLQYFACGEYGTHADGRGYGRPHFHNIIFTDSPLSVCDFERAWTIDNYRIGRVDFVDMNDAVFINPIENLKVFKYVCKYLQKVDFDFEKLATIDFHRSYFESINYVFEHQTDLFDGQFIYSDSQFTSTEKDALWREYIKQYSPFVVCSRRPAIGSAYLAENLDRFTAQDFRLFGLPMEGLAFPRYYKKKSAQALCPFDCIGSESEKPSSSSRMGHIVSLLGLLYSTRLDVDNWTEVPTYNWRICYKKDGIRNSRFIECDRFSPIKCRDLNFYDRNNKFFYQFDGYMYNVWCKLKNGAYSLLDKMDIYDVLKEIHPSWERFHKVWITPLHQMSVISERELNDYITHMYKPTDLKTSMDLFRDEVAARYKVELDTRYLTKLKMQNSKQTL